MTGVRNVADEVLFHGRLVDRILEILAQDAPSLVVVRGRRGSGKTFLARHLAQRGWRAPLPMGDDAGGLGIRLGRMIGTLPLDVVDEVRRRLREGRQCDPYVLAGGICQALARSRARGLRLVIDDVHAWDPSELVVLSLITARVPAGTLGVVVLSDERAPLTGLSHGAGLHMVAADEEALMAAIEARRGQRVHRSVVRAVSRATDGLPGAALHVIDGLVGGQLDGTAPLPYPLGMDELEDQPLLDAVARVDEGQATALRLLSACPSIPRQDVVAVAGANAPGLFAKWGVSVSSGGRIRLRSQSQHAALFERLVDPRYRLEFHRACAEDSRLSPEHRLWHASYGEGEVGKVVRNLVDAVVVFLRSSEVGLAYAYLGRIAHWAPLPGNTLPDLFRAAEAFFFAGEFDAARQATEMARVAGVPGSGSELIDGLRLRIDFMSSGSLTFPLLPERSGPVMPGQWQLGRVLALLYSVEQWDLPLAREMADGIDVDSRTGAGPFARHAVGLLQVLQGQQPDVDVGSPTPEIGDTPLTASRAAGEILIRSRILTYQGQYDRAGALLQDLDHQLRPRTHLWHSVARLYSIENDSAAGKVSTALSAAGAMTDEDPLAQTPYHRFYRYWYVFETQGDQAARPFHVRLVASLEQQRNNLIETRLYAFVGAVALRRGDGQVALRRLLRARAMSQVIEDPQIAQIDPMLVEAFVMEGDVAGGREALHSLQRRADAYPSAWSEWAVGWAAAVLEDETGAFHRHAAAAAATAAPVMIAHSLSALSRHLRRTGDHRSADSVLDEVREVLRGGGFTTWLDDISIQASAGSVVNFGALSAGEAEVVSQAGAGLSNKEIAAALFVSLRTVESRLTSAYRKLGIRNRGDLIRRFAQRGA